MRTNCPTYSRSFQRFVFLSFNSGQYFLFLVPSTYPICVVQVFLDVMIGFNGNYDFFNLLTVAIYFLLLDDSVF